MASGRWNFRLTENEAQRHMKNAWQEIRLYIGQTVMWWSIRICGSGGFHDEMLVAFRNAMQRDADRLKAELERR